MALETQPAFQFQREERVCPKPSESVGSPLAKKDGFYFLRHRANYCKHLAVFSKRFSFLALVVRPVHTRAVFFAMRQEAEECLPPGEVSLAFHRRKRLPESEGAAGVLAWEPSSQTSQGSTTGKTCAFVSVFPCSGKDMDR